MGRSTVVRSVLVAVLVAGALGAVGPEPSYASFSDAHQGTAAFNASTSFGGGGGGGPTADAGGPYTVYENDSVQLDGTGSTASKGSLTYSWTILSGNGTLSGANTATPTYVAPDDVDANETVTVELTVTDNSGSDSDRTEITVRDADGGCGATKLTFCSLSIADSGDGRYDVTYQVEDPSGGSAFDRVEVTLLKKQNPKDTAASRKLAATLTVTGKSGKRYTIRVRLYDLSGSVVECKEATDVADGTDPSQRANC